MRPSLNVAVLENSQMGNFFKTFNLESRTLVCQAERDLFSTNLSDYLKTSLADFCFN